MALIDYAPKVRKQYIEDLDDYWFVDVHPELEASYSKPINNGEMIVYVTVSPENGDYVIKGVKYSKEHYKYEDVLQKINKLRSYKIDGHLENSKSKECTICKGLNRLKNMRSLTVPQLRQEENIEAVNEYKDKKSFPKDSEFLFKTFLFDLPGKFLFTPIGRKVMGGFLLLLCSFVRDLVTDEQKESVNRLMDLIINDELSISESELPDLYNNVSSLFSGNFRDAILRNPDEIGEYLSRLGNKEKDSSRKKKKSKFI